MELEGVGFTTYCGAATGPFHERQVAEKAEMQLLQEESDISISHTDVRYHLMSAHPTAI
jgi:hypothetical protein